MFASTLRVAGRAGVRGLAGLPKYDEASNISMRQLMPAIAVLAGDVCNTLDSWQYLTLFDHLIHKVLESICLLPFIYVFECLCVLGYQLFFYPYLQ